MLFDFFVAVFFCVAFCFVAFCFVPFFLGGVFGSSIGLASEPGAVPPCATAVPIGLSLGRSQPNDLTSLSSFVGIAYMIGWGSGRVHTQQDNCCCAVARALRLDREAPASWRINGHSTASLTSKKKLAANRTTKARIKRVSPRMIAAQPPTPERAASVASSPVTIFLTCGPSDYGTRGNKLDC